MVHVEVLEIFKVTPYLLLQHIYPGTTQFIMPVPFLFTPLPNQSPASISLFPSRYQSTYMPRPFLISSSALRYAYLTPTFCLLFG